MNKKSEEKHDLNKKKIIEATVSLIDNKGIDAVTVRSICKEAGISIGKFYYYFQGKEDVIFYFVTQDLFDFPLQSPKNEVVKRQVELYMHLINAYKDFGLSFMKNFYSTSNQALSAYTGDKDGHFTLGSIMQRSENELTEAIEDGYLNAVCQAHLLAKDICTIVKGIVFEWCLCDGAINLDDTIERIIGNYLCTYLK